jgi:glycine/D-amino acid oxidase-like deaminating enzyme
MQVRSGLSVWRALRPHQPIPSASGDAHCEVVVLGAGISGALVAYYLLREGVNVVLVDKGEPGEGSTAASTGLLQYEVDTPLVELARKVGIAKAAHAYRRGLRAIDEIEALVDELGDRCGFSRRNTFYFATRLWHVLRLKHEFTLRREQGFDVHWLSRREVSEQSSIRSAGAIVSSGDGQIDPYRLVTTLVHKSQSAGLRVYTHAPISQIDEDGPQVVVETAKGTIQAGRIVYAVGYESARFLDRRVGKLHSTYALASRPLATSTGWPDDSLIWETARPYFYARRGDDGRAIIGGGDTAFATDHERDGLVERKVAALAARFHQLFPRIDLVPEFAWAGTFGETKDGLAYIGQPPGRPKAYFAIGYGGNGITFSMIAARLIADLYLGRPNDDARVFRFDR